MYNRDTSSFSVKNIPATKQTWESAMTRTRLICSLYVARRPFLLSGALENKPVRMLKRVGFEPCYILTGVK